jgi:hypothetical protein
MGMTGIRQVVLMQRTVAIAQTDIRRADIGIVVGMNDLRQQQAGEQDVFKSSHFESQVTVLR